MAIPYEAQGYADCASIAEWFTCILCIPVKKHFTGFRTIMPMSLSPMFTCRESMEWN